MLYRTRTSEMALTGAPCNIADEQSLGDRFYSLSLSHDGHSLCLLNALAGCRSQVPWHGLRPSESSALLRHGAGAGFILRALEALPSVHIGQQYLKT